MEAELDLYKTYLNSIQATDEISFKLLGLVPLISGAGIFALLTKTTMEVAGTDLPVPLWLFWVTGVFGALTTFFIFRWELRNIQLCECLREQAKKLEARITQLNGNGLYMQLPPAPGKIGKKKAESWIYCLTIFFWLLMPIIKTVTPAYII